MSGRRIVFPSVTVPALCSSAVVLAQGTVTLQVSAGAAAALYRNDTLVVPIIRRTVVALGFIASAVTGAPHLYAQGTITLAAGQTPSTLVLPSAKLAVPIVIDMSAAVGGTNLASLLTTVSWGQSRLTFDSVTAGAFGTLTPNTWNATNGTATLSLSSGTGTTSTVTIATMHFTAAGSAGGTRVLLGPSAAADQSAASVLSLLRSRSLDVCVAPNGLWGDVNADGTVNIIDAQQIARASVGLSVANVAAVTARGDVTADGSVNIIDAQQIARFSVGLIASARVNTSQFVAPAVATVAITPSAPSVAPGGVLQLTATPRDAGTADLTGCAPVAWTSSDPTRATIDPNSGLVTGVAAGAATITASAGGVTATSVITVASATGVRLAVTSPRPASRWYVVVDSGALTTPQVSRFAVNNRRVDTLLVSLPAGSGYRVRLVVADSASTNPDDSPLVTAGGLLSGVSVVAGSLTPQSIAATTLSAVVTIPDTVVGGTVPIDLTLTDPSQVLSAATYCATFYFGTASWATDGYGASSAYVCTATRLSPTTVRYTSSVTTPTTAGVLFSQILVLNLIAGQYFSFYVPSRQLGQPLRTTAVVIPTTGVRLAVTSPRPASRWYVVTDSGTLTSPQVSKFPGNNRRVDTLLVPLLAGSGYRVRLVVADSASTYPDDSPLATAGGRISGVSVVAGSLTPQSIAATALSAVVTMPDSMLADARVSVDMTLTDPSQVLSATGSCAVLYSGAVSWAWDDAGASVAFLCTMTTPSPTTVRYAGSVLALSSPGMMFSQFQAQGDIAGQNFSFFIPSRQLGQPLRTTAVVNPATINAFGTTANKVSILAIGSAITPGLVTTAGSTGAVTTTDPTITFVARSPAIATVDGTGRITAVAPGQAWVAATSTRSNSDSVLIIVPRSSGPILRTDLTRFAFRDGDTVTARVQVDTRGATLGAVTATVTWSYGPLSFIDISTTGSPMAPVSTINQSGRVILIINGESAAGVTGLVHLAVVRFIVRSSGLTRIFLNATELLGADFSNLLPSTTFTQYPVIVP